jgi:hypothetical protein
LERDVETYKLSKDEYKKIAKKMEDECQRSSEQMDEDLVSQEPVDSCSLESQAGCLSVAGETELIENDIQNENFQQLLEF